jgi:hypothetical protein
MLKEMDPHLYGHNGTFPESALYDPYLAPGNWSNVVELTYVPDYDIPLSVPFTFWVVGAACSFLFFYWRFDLIYLVDNDTTFLKQHRRSKGRHCLSAELCALSLLLHRDWLTDHHGE